MKKKTHKLPILNKGSVGSTCMFTIRSDTTPAKVGKLRHIWSCLVRIESDVK